MKARPLGTAGRPPTDCKVHNPIPNFPFSRRNLVIAGFVSPLRAANAPKIRRSLCDDQSNVCCALCAILYKSIYNLACHANNLGGRSCYAPGWGLGLCSSKDSKLGTSTSPVGDVCMTSNSNPGQIVAMSLRHWMPSSCWMTMARLGRLRAKQRFSKFAPDCVTTVSSAENSSTRSSSVIDAVVTWANPRRRSASARRSWFRITRFAPAALLFALRFA